MDNVWEKVYTSALRFMVLQDTQDIYQLIIKEALELVKADFGSIFIVNDKAPVRVYSSYSKLNKVLAKKGGKIYSSFITGNSMLIKTSKQSSHPEFKGLGIKSGIIVPLVYGGITIGVVSVLSKRENLDTHELDVMKLFAPLATLSIRKAMLTYELKEALEVRDLFMSLAAHELKTPLTIISAYNDSLLRIVTDPKEKKYALKIKNGAQRLKSLINEFLLADLTNKGELNYKFRKTEMVRLAKRTVENFRKINKNYKFIFKSTSESIYIKIDGEKIIEIILNLLNNAVKFSAPDSTITINIKADRTKVMLSVTDKGEGIANEDLKRVFGKFEKGSSRKSGMGLGLYLAKQIVEAHKGEINVKSKVGKGTSVIIALPRLK